jgi:UPF0148 protein
MAADKADEIMAEYLLKGGKMLAKSCKACGYPMFEYKGETQCVICQTGAPAEAAPEAANPVPAPGPALPPAHPGAAAEALELTLVHLCERIRSEPRAGECLSLMEAVLKGAEALAILGQR